MEQEAAHYTENDPQSHTPPPSQYSSPRTGSKSSSSSASSLSHPSQVTQSWPSKGELHLDNVCLRYREGLPLVLDRVTLTIKSKEKVGIVGRTGAGKSSLVTAILRMVEMESGSILIDGVDITGIGLNALRSRIAVIPQDPVLFSGSIRSNLDPFLIYTDTQIWDSLRRAMLSTSIRSLEDQGAIFSSSPSPLLPLFFTPITPFSRLLSSAFLTFDFITFTLIVNTPALHI